MPAILGANSASDAYDVSNSIRFNDDDSAYMQYTPSSASTSRKKWTWSGWVKRGEEPTDDNADYHRFFSVDADGNNYIITGFLYSGGFNVTARVGGSEVLKFETGGGQFRDHAAWYHIVMAYDSTQGTARNRFRVYFNGVEDTRALDTTPNQNQELTVLDTSEHNIGRDNHGTAYYYDGYLSEVHFIDGTQYAASDFGKFNSDGVWIPTDFSGSYGTNGFRLEFKQTGTSANSSGMGADTSGNDNHLTPNNLVATDITTDTCTNNFNTLNPNANALGGTLSEGNLKCVGVNAADKHVFGTFSLTRGKWYFEIKATDRNARGSVWVSDTDHSAVIGTNYAGISMHSGGAVTSGTSNSNLDQAPTDGDIVCYAVDLDNGQVWFSRNANIDTSGTANITGLATSGLDRDYRISQRETGNPASTFEHNYGNAPYAISSGNSDAEGFGNFEYAVPSGYFALCTKNLAEYG